MLLCERGNIALLCRAKTQVVIVFSFPFVKFLLRLIAICLYTLIFCKRFCLAVAATYPFLEILQVYGGYHRLVLLRPIFVIVGEISRLGIGRLIYQLPTTLCEMFLQEVFKKNPIDALDKETLFTINKFFENNLILSETARKLFVHRNTLVYRLEKIKKLTGLDLREFDDAITFKVALMVKKYLASRGIEA